MKYWLFLQFSLFSMLWFAQTAIISGYAPKYIGKHIEIYAIDDYISNHQTLIGQGEVKADSTFEFKVPCTEIQKVNIVADLNKSFLYIQPGAKYSLYIPEKDKFEPYRPNGSKIEITFLDLDSTDINYKILGFERYTNNFVAQYYHLKGLRPAEFGTKITELKTNLENYYKKDTNLYFLTYIRYTVALIDNIQFAGDRGRYEKFDFYLKTVPIFEKNDAYMNYVNQFYENLEGYLSVELNNEIYFGIKNSSPNRVMKALESEYTLSNVKMRELIMLKHLSKLYYSSDYPKRNIITILDSVSKYSYFKSNKIVARNLAEQLTKLNPGSKAPKFDLMDLNGMNYSLENFQNKHTYLIFLDLNSNKSTEVINPLLGLYQKYKSDINFVLFYKEENLNEEAKKLLGKIEWTKIPVQKTDNLWKDYLIETTPYFVLLTPESNIYAAPAYSPLPNSNRRTIEETFFGIKRSNQQRER